MTKKVYLISCSSSQSRIDPNEKREARFVYQGQIFQKSYTLARQIMESNDDLLILSSCLNHPVVAPNDMITPYDSGNPANWTVNQKNQWADAAFEALKKRYDLDKTEFIPVCNGTLVRILTSKYKSLFKEILIEGNNRCEYPAKLNELINQPACKCPDSSKCKHHTSCHPKEKQNL